MPVELDELERRRIQLEIEREALRKEQRRRVEGAARRARAGAGRPRRAGQRAQEPVGAGEGQDRRAAHRPRSSSKSFSSRSSRPSEPPTTGAAAELKYGKLPELQKQLAEPGGCAGRRQARAGCSRKRSTRTTSPDRGDVDGHPGHAAAGGRAGQADPHGGRAAPARRRPGRGRRGRGRRGPARAGRAARTPSGRSARSSSLARPASARPSWRARWPSSCSTTSRP